MLTKQPRYYFDQDAIREAHAETTDPRPVGTRGEQGWAAAHLGGPQRDSNGGVGAHAAGRNRRSVWTIPTQPVPFAHFACFPEALVRPCILAGTSEKGECVECGAPWVREVERGESDYARLKGERDWRDLQAEQIDRGADQDGRTGKHTLTASGSVPSLKPRSAETTGWRASCTCDAPTRPQLVLDPFIGSGTTALVARNHNRRCIGIDLSEAYLTIAAKRLQQLSLFAE